MKAKHTTHLKYIKQNMVVSPYVEFDYGFITSNIHLRNQQTPIAYLVNVNERMLIR